MAIYYVQYASSRAPDRWYTIARVDERRLADEMARLAGTAFMRLTLTSSFVGRAVSRSALKREGGLHHAEWELGFGRDREYCERLRERAERELRRAEDGGT